MRDLVAPAGVTIRSDGDELIVRVAAPTVEEEIELPGAEEVEVIAKAGEEEEVRKSAFAQLSGRAGPAASPPFFVPVGALTPLLMCVMMKRQERMNRCSRMGREA